MQSPFWRRNSTTSYSAKERRECDRQKFQTTQPKKLQLARLRARRLKAGGAVKRKRGAPPGNRNAFKHGRYAAERLALLSQIRAHIKDANALAESIHSNLRPTDVMAPRGCKYE